MLLESGVLGLEELLEPGGVFVELVQALDGDAECGAGFVEGGHGSLNAVELSFEGVEEFGQLHLAEPVFEARHSSVSGGVLDGVAEIADVVAADIEIFHGDLAAELSVGKIELAEADWHGHRLSLKRKGPRMAVLLGILLLFLFYRVRKIHLHWPRKFFANGMKGLQGNAGRRG